MPSAKHVEIVSSFVECAPPGELSNVVADIESLTADIPGLVDTLDPAFQAYNEAQFTTVVLPGSSDGVPAIVSADSALGDGRYIDPASATSFVFDHRTQKAGAAQSYILEGAQADLIKSTIISLETYAKDHYERPAFGVYSIDGDSKIAVLLVSNKYSPQNFCSGALEGTIRVDVHYYEDGNVRLLTEKPHVTTVTTGGAAAAALVREIAALEKAYQEELNKKFLALSEGAFKSLRRQLPVTRQKIEWDKVASYRLGQDIGGSSGRK